MRRGQTTPIPAGREGMCVPSPWQAWAAVILCIVAGAVPLADAQPLVSEAREILASGDEVEGFGRVGFEDFKVVGIANDDRVVFTAETSTGAEGVFSTDGSDVQALWLASDPNGSPARLGRVRTNANRVVFAEGFSTTDVFNNIDGFYQISGGAAVPVVELGDITPDGDEVCILVEFVVSATGAVVFSAYTAPPEDACDFAASSEDLYVFEAGSIRRVLRTGDTQPPQFSLIGLAGDGVLLTGLSDGSAILGVRNGKIETIAARGETSPSGAPFGFLNGRASNSLGEVAFDDSHTLYRTDSGRIVRVAGRGDTIAGEYELEMFTGLVTALNDAGDIVIRLQLPQTGRSPLQGTVLFLADGTSRLLARFGIPGGINDRGVAAVLEAEDAPETEPADFVARGTEAPLERLVSVGDAAPDGGVFAVRGIATGASCLASDGRVAAIVSTDRNQALACGDAESFVSVAGPDNPMPDGSVVTFAGICAFAETGMLFSGTRPDESRGVYLADSGGLQRLIGPGDVTTGGDTIVTLVNLRDGAGPGFTWNERGTVVARVLIGANTHYVRRRPGGGLETIPFDLGNDVAIERYVSAGIRDDDTVVVSVELDTGEYAIVTANGTSAEVLATSSDPRLPGGPFDVVTVPFVVGDRVVILGTAFDRGEETILYTDAAGFVPFFEDQVNRPVEDATAGGRALVEEFGDRILTQFLLSPDGSLSQIAEFRSLADPRAVAINDRGNVLFITEGTALGTQRHSLSIAGPAPSARCPRAPTPETPQPTPTSSSTETPVPTGTSTPTPTLVPSSTPTPTLAEPTHTETPTQTPVPSATVASASPTAVVDPVQFGDGCQAVPPRRTHASLLLPVFAVLARGMGRRRRARRQPLPRSRDR